MFQPVIEDIEDILGTTVQNAEEDEETWKEKFSEQV